MMETTEVSGDRTGDAERVPSLADAVARWAKATPDAPACTYVDYEVDRDGHRTTWTYAELDAQARRAAAALLELAQPGDRVAILLPQGLDYLASFLGCLYAGLLAVPLFAPEMRRSNDRVLATLQDAQPAVTLTTRQNLASVRDLHDAGVDCGTVIAPDELAPAGPALDGARTVDPDTTAYLQYTSGSTRRPAGVMVTHHNLAAGCIQLQAACGIGYSGPTVSWLPFFHDMGLLLGIAAPLHAGGHSVCLSPFAFVQRPIRWLRQLSEFRAAVTGSPNFGLNLAVTRVREAERADLDLSHLSALLNGAEPIRAATLRAFTEVYRRYGFRHSAHRPGYGLAEATLTVTLSQPTTPPTIQAFDRAALAVGKVVPVAEEDGEASVLVGCGVPRQQQIRIVSPDTLEEAEEGTVGEVWVHGPNVCRGYFRRPDDTARTFQARLASPDTAPADRSEASVATLSAAPSADVAGVARSRGWLRTGDLGFVHAGELFIASRLKDLIIINGHNHYPADIEVTVEQALPEARPGHVAAFPVEVDGGEALVLVVEIEPKHARTLDHRKAVTRIREAVSHGHEIQPHDIVLARPGAIPKTTSGKIQRATCRARYLEGALASHAPAVTP